MFDQHAYRTIFQAAMTFLERNGRQVGREFAEGFAFDHDPGRGQQSMQNADNLLKFVVHHAQRLNNGRNVVADDQQLFDIVGAYISDTFDRWRSQQRVSGGGFGGGTLGFGRTSSFGNSGGFGNSGRQTLGFGQQQNPGPASHLDDDEDTRSSPSTRTTEAPKPVSAPLDLSTASMKSSVKMVDNPLDKFPETGVEFSPVEVRPVWGVVDDNDQGELARDRRLVLFYREELKTRSRDFQMTRACAYHQCIMSDPLDVAKDFFRAAPDSTLGTSFLFAISYQHLEVIDVPTDEFVDIRDRCIDAIKKDRNAVIHRKIAEVLGGMRRDPWKAMSAYLTHHVNRALHLACRLTSQPAGRLRIGGLDDLDELLSSTFKHPVVMVPDGRHNLEKIVSAALWNALVLNSTVMFTNTEEFPLHAVQSSPAFPFSMEGVYPNKFSIPQPGSELFETFVDRLKTQELSKRTYVVSKRKVLVTNILGKKVLTNLTATPTLINNAIASLLSSFTIPYTDVRIEGNVEVNGPVSFMAEGDLTKDLEDYYADPLQYEGNEIDASPGRKSFDFPVDQAIFAVQYGVKPEEYMTSLDIFSTVDNKLTNNQVIMATHPISTIGLTA